MLLSSGASTLSRSVFLGGGAFLQGTNGVSSYRHIYTHTQEAAVRGDCVVVVVVVFLPQVSSRSAGARPVTLRVLQWFARRRVQEEEKEEEADVCSGRRGGGRVMRRWWWWQLAVKLTRQTFSKWLRCANHTWRKTLRSQDRKSWKSPRIVLEILDWVSRQTVRRWIMWQMNLNNC